jgi:hypothetical protein
VRQRWSVRQAHRDRVGIELPEPGAEQRTDYLYGCRIYWTESGASGQPDERWLRDAISAAHEHRPG